MNGFDSARLKIGRAKHHIDDLSSIVDSLPDLYTSSIETDPQGRGRSIRYHLANSSELQKKIALILGDAIHNLKTALDHAWITASKSDPADRHAKFPVRLTANDLENTLRGREIHISRATLFNHMMSVVKPYPGGNWDIHVIHELDIIDKRRVILTLIKWVEVEGIVVEDENGLEISGDGGTVSTGDTVHVAFPINYKIKNHRKPSVHISFDDGELTQSREILDTLEVFSRLVTSLVEDLERIA